MFRHSTEVFPVGDTHSSNEIPADKDMTEAGQWWVYLIANTAGRSYVGATCGVDAERRLAEHNGGLSRAAKATRGRGPWVLVHVEPAPDKSAALSREWHLKRDRRQRRALLTAYQAQTTPRS